VEGSKIEANQNILQITARSKQWRYTACWSENQVQEQ